MPNKNSLGAVKRVLPSKVGSIRICKNNKTKNSFINTLDVIGYNFNNLPNHCSPQGHMSLMASQISEHPWPAGQQILH